jgi:hypothetical protein
MEPRERVALKNRIDGLNDEERRQIGERLQEKMQGIGIGLFLYHFWSERTFIPPVFEIRLNADPYP